MSDISSSSGAASLARLIIRASRPSRCQASLPMSSLWWLTPNVITAIDAGGRDFLDRRIQLAFRNPENARHQFDRREVVEALLDEDRIDQIVDRNAVFLQQIPRIT